MKSKTFITTAEGTNLYNLLTSKSSYTSNAVICWEPHLGIYFLEKNKIVNYVEVSLDCNRLMSALKIKEAESVKAGRINVPTGMTPEFRKVINSLLVKYHFTHQLIPGSRYD